MSGEQTIRERTLGDLQWILGWLSIMWIVEAADHLLRAVTGGTRTLDALGVVPRTPMGLLGIAFAPFLHASWTHLIHNSISLLITGMISCRYGRRLTLAAACYAAIYGGLLTWLIGDADFGHGTTQHQVHVGCSGVIFGLIGFVLINAAVRRGCAPLLLGLLMFFLYGAAILGGIVPDSDRMISWQMHLGGLIGGVSAGWHLRNRKAR